MCGHIFTIFVRGPQYLELGDRPSRLRRRGIRWAKAAGWAGGGGSLDEGPARTRKRKF